MKQEELLTIDEIEKRPLKYFDFLLDAYLKEKQNPSATKINKKNIIRSLLSIGGNVKDAINCQDEEVEILGKDALDHYQEITNKDLIGACYLRLLAKPEIEWVSSAAWRPKIIGFLDYQFKGSMYKEWKIDEKLQSHEKVKFLEKVIPNYVRKLSTVLTALTSLDRLSATRQKLLECLNNKSGKLIFQPFLPENTQSLISDIFDKCLQFKDQKESFTIINYFNETKEAIDLFICKLNQEGTEYSLLLINEFCIPIKHLVDDEFRNNTASQPASLVIKPTLKKYPFHMVGKFINLDFNIFNEAPGVAYETKLEIITDNDKIKIVSPVIIIGRISPNEHYPIQISTIIEKECKETEVYIVLEWRDFNGEQKSSEYNGVLSSQRTDINWDRLQQTDSYSLEPVNNENQLVGRKDVLNQLNATINTVNTGSTVIHGQKRVGKTSIVKVLQTRLTKQEIKNVYLEVGDFILQTADSTIKRLGDVLCRKLSEIDNRIPLINKPNFDEGFSPICDYIDSIIRLMPDKKIVIIIDEFDQLPTDLYLKGNLSDPFFETLRSLSSRENIGFILVGGERMSHILDNQGSRLNKWKIISVDYFTKENNWTDYIELIQRPVENILEYSIEAISQLHQLTAGNPYFTKLICQYIFLSAIKNRDCSISTFEINQSVDQALIETKANTFQHFWDDHIFFTGEKAIETSTRRRKILIALAEIVRTKQYATGKALSEHPILKNSPQLESDLKEFVTRKVLDGNLSGGFNEHEYLFKVKFFEQWMMSHGMQDIISTFADLDSLMLEKQRNEELRVKSKELTELVKQWGIFKGHEITSENVRAWIDQFTQINEQRVMFSALKGVKFYTNSFLREKMSEAHKIATRQLPRKIKYRQQKRSDILVSYLDSAAKSGASIVRLYADDAEVYVDNVIEQSKIFRKIEDSEEIQAIVFLDDFVGTGDQAIENLTKIYKEIGEKAKEKQIRIVFIAVIAVINGWRNLIEQIEKLNLDIEIHYCELIDEKAKYFSENSEIFRSQADREAAKSIAIKYGKQLVKDNPLGYGSLGLGIVFEHGCPNDSLPILWKESSSPQWTPLFRRL